MRSTVALLTLMSAIFLTRCGDPCEKRIDQGFLQKAAVEEGAVQTASGLIYKELVPGYGPKPEAGDRVTVHYKGMLSDGTVFDSSIERGRPSKLSLKRVIPGWVEGLQMMKGGGKARLVIPPHLGYGEKGKSPNIPPCAILIFEIELLGIQAG